MKTTIFKTITTGESKASLEKKLEKYSVSSWAQELIDKMQVSKKKEEIDLVILTPRDLGFTEYPTTTEFFARAKEWGYDLCPAEMGPLLRVNYDDQPEDEWLYIAMEPITDSDGDPDVFGVERDGDDRWLDGNWAGPGGQWGLGYLVVFRLRKGSALSSDTTTSSDSLSVELRVKKLEDTLEAIKQVLLDK